MHDKGVSELKSRLICELVNTPYQNMTQLKECIEKLLKTWMEIYLLKENDEDTCKNKIYIFAEELAEAIIEDFYVEKEASRMLRDLRERDDNPEVLRHVDDNSEIAQNLNNAINCIINEVDNKFSNIAVYTSEYYLRGTHFKAAMKRYNNYLQKLSSDIYQKIYPVFWIEMLNCKFSDRNDNFKDSLLDPIFERNKEEKYIFALLADTRAFNRKETMPTIIETDVLRRYKRNPDGIYVFYEDRKEDEEALYDAVIQEGRLLIKIAENNLDEKKMDEMRFLDFEKKSIEKKIESYQAKIKQLEKEKNSLSPIKKQDMSKLKDRIDFVNWYKQELLKEKKDTNRQKKIFSNTLEVLKSLVEIGEAYSLVLDPVMLIYFLERLTCWVDFHFFVKMKKKSVSYSSDSEKRAEYISYFQRSCSICVNQIAVFQCLDRNMKKENSVLGDMPDIIMNSFMEWIIDIFLSLGRRYNSEAVKPEKCVNYEQLYSELLENETKDIYTKMDAVEFYLRYDEMRDDKETLFNQDLDEW